MVRKLSKGHRINNKVREMGRVQPLRALPTVIVLGLASKEVDSHVGRKGHEGTRV